VRKRSIIAPISVEKWMDVDLPDLPLHLDQIIIGQLCFALERDFKRVCKTT
jgi:hypothetical protein